MLKFSLQASLIPSKVKRHLKMFVKISAEKNVEIGTSDSLFVFLWAYMDTLTKISNASVDETIDILKLCKAKIQEPIAIVDDWLALEPNKLANAFAALKRNFNFVLAINDDEEAKKSGLGI